MLHQKPTINVSEHVGNIIFDKKEDSSKAKLFTLEEMVVNYSNEVLGIRVMSVALPPNYSAQPKTEAQVIDWLRNRVHSRYTFAYSIALKYGEKLKVKSEQKQPYNNN
jgi:hypothetical protein